MSHFAQNLACVVVATNTTQSRHHIRTHSVRTRQLTSLLLTTYSVICHTACDVTNLYDNLVMWSAKITSEGVQQHLIQLQVVIGSIFGTCLFNDAITTLQLQHYFRAQLEVTLIIYKQLNFDVYRRGLEKHKSTYNVLLQDQNWDWNYCNIKQQCWCVFQDN